MANLYQPKNAEELSQRFLRDVRLASIQSGNDDVPVGYGSDFWLTAQGLAGIGLLGFSNISLSEADQNVLTAEGQALDTIRVSYGLQEVSASKSRGKIIVKISGATTITNGQTFVYPNGKSGRVIGTYVNPSDSSDVNVECTTTGSSGDLRAGETVRFIGTPVNVGSEAKVSSDSPITGGTDTESDARKRLRILNVLRNKPAGGNWSHVRQLVLDFNGSIQDCFVYPALGGPSSVKVVPVKDFNLIINDFSRTVSDALLASVRNHLQSNLPVGVEVVLQSAASEPTDITLKLTIPESSQSGGSGQGWTDIVLWPKLVSGDSNKVSVTSVSGTFDTLTVSANTTAAPIDGQTHIAWWSSVDRKFYGGLIISHSGSSGAWTVTLDRPIVDSTGAGPQSGDYISPLCQNINGYASGFVSMFRKLGSGENTSSANRLPRARRHPVIAAESPHSITNATLKSMVVSFPEITDFSIGYALKTSPTVPSLTAIAPNVLIPRKFAVYQL